jgi:ribosomal protein S18 acetylase RimI-like enzyme
MPPLSYRPISQVDFDVFTTAFNQAYSDYFVPITMTVPTFRALIARDDVDLDASVVALDGDVIVGTGLLGIRDNVGWIGGMGVIPGRRRQGIGRQMMVFLLDRARERGLQQIHLEVIEANRGAYALYRQLGFVDQRYLLVVERSPGQPPNLPLLYPVEEWSANSVLQHYPAFHDLTNCWQRDLPSLQALTSHVQSWAALDNGKVIGYALGWAGQNHIQLVDLAAAPTRDHETIARALLTHLHRQYPGAHGNTYNIVDSDPVLPAYEALGYTVTLRQIEMHLTLAPA